MQQAQNITCDSAEALCLLHPAQGVKHLSAALRSRRPAQGSLEPSAGKGNKVQKFWTPPQSWVYYYRGYALLQQVACGPENPGPVYTNASH